MPKKNNKKPKKFTFHKEEIDFDNIKDQLPNLKWIKSISNKPEITKHSATYKSKINDYIWKGVSSPDNRDAKNLDYQLSSANLYYKIHSSISQQTEEKGLHFQLGLLRSISVLFKSLLDRVNIEASDFSSFFSQLSDQKISFNLNLKGDDQVLGSQLNFLIFLLRNIIHNTPVGTKFHLSLLMKFFETILSINVAHEHKLNVNVLTTLTHVINLIYSSLKEFGSSILPFVDPVVTVLTYQLEFTTNWSLMKLEHRVPVINLRLSIIRCITELLNTCNGMCTESLTSHMNRILFQTSMDLERISHCNITKVLIKLEDECKVSSKDQERLYLANLIFVNDLFRYHRSILYPLIERSMEKKVFDTTSIEIQRLSIVLILILKRIFNEISGGQFFNQASFKPASNHELFNLNCLEYMARSITAIGLHNTETCHRGLVLRFINMLCHHYASEIRKVGRECLLEVNQSIPLLLNGMHLSRNVEEYLERFATNIVPDDDKSQTCRENCSQTDKVVLKMITTQTQPVIISSEAQNTAGKSQKVNKRELPESDGKRKEKKMKTCPAVKAPAISDKEEKMHVNESVDAEVESILNEFNPNFL